jgi:hypothetical protein
MKTQLTDRDYELISAYLDQQLTQKESAGLEARMGAERALQVALDEMRKTRYLLRSIPKLRAPRNFTLTSEMAGVKQKRGFQLFPTLRLSSALASLLLIFAFLGEFLMGSARLPTMMLAEAPAGGSEAMEMAHVIPESQDMEQAAEAEDTPGEEIFSLMAPQAGVETDEVEGFGVMAYPEPEEGGEAELRVQAVEPEVESPYPPPTAKLDAQETLPPGAGGGIIEDAEIYQAANARINLWRIAQITLALLALTTGIAAWFAHRRSL